MPAFTYLRDTEYTAPTRVKALDDGLRDLRLHTGDDWRIGWFTAVIGPWWRRRPVTLYSLYCGVGSGEFQIINFYRDGIDWTINHSVPAELIVAYMFGAFVKQPLLGSGDQ